ncbi:hypothetical protein F2Q70_00039134 [Brassica cretica]|uniref:Uncharacterized protein n=1 Tax=Brassica cretica TaxID=69181 RepID=A0A8S9K3I9_BRACR|nr:hypothetical protein F2Q70_00039134 [Brassica cretica]KAF2617084.1 hypothetical protein F2Q68_00039827 [Brassica cretica]
MPQDDTVSGASGDKSTPTHEAAPPISADFMSSIMARFTHQDEVQKATNKQLPALVAALTAPAGQTSRPQPFRRKKSPAQGEWQRPPNESQSKDDDKAPKDDGGDDCSVDEEQPTNRRCQQALSSDDENDDTPPFDDLRDFLKRKLEPEDSNNPIDTDLRLTLNAT